MTCNASKANSSKALRLVVLYENDSGIGDVGKHVVSQALSQGIFVCGISEKPSLLQEVASVSPIVLSDEQLLANVTIDIANMTPTDRSTLEKSLDGADAVVACSWSRQPGHNRFASKWMEELLAAMKKREVQRLVVVSSTGIGDDWPPFPWSFTIGNLFSIILACATPWSTSIYSDLSRMEQSIQSSENIDYVIIRPMGLAPEEAPRRDAQPDIVEAGGKQPMEFNIAKEDVASLVLREAVLAPSLHRRAVSVGWLLKQVES